MRTYFRLTSFALALLAATQVAGQTLEAREPFRKPNDRHLTATENATGEIVVKFHDHVRARVTSAGQLTFPGDSKSLRTIRGLLRGASVRPAINASPLKLEAIQSQAAARSGKAQPDLAGMISVWVADAEDTIGIETLARRLNRHPLVEFATIKHSLKVSSSTYGGWCALPVTPLLCVQVVDEEACEALGGFWNADTPCSEPAPLLIPFGPCCLPDQTCEDTTSDECALDGGSWRGIYDWDDANNDGVATNDELTLSDLDELDVRGEVGRAYTCADTRRGACWETAGPGEDPPSFFYDDDYRDFVNDPNAVFNNGQGVNEEGNEVDNATQVFYGACCLPAGGPASEGGCLDLSFFDCFAIGGRWAQPDAFETQDSEWEPGGYDQGSCVTLDEDGEEADEYDCFDNEAHCSALGDDGFNDFGGLNAFGFYGCFFNAPWVDTNLSPSSGGPSCNNIDCCDAVILILPDCAEAWDTNCVQLAKNLDDCGGTVTTGATTLYGGSVYMPYRDEPTSSDYRTPCDADVVRLVTQFDQECDSRWDMTCAEYARLFSYRLSVVGDANTDRDGVRTPDLTGLQHNLSAEPFPFEFNRVANVLDELSDEEGATITQKAEARYISSLPRVQLNTVAEVPAYSGAGLGVRGLPGEPFVDSESTDTNGDTVTDTPGWWTIGEAWSDFGIDGEQAVYEGGATAPVEVDCFPIPVNLVALAEVVYGTDQFFDDPSTDDIEWFDADDNPITIGFGDPIPCEVLGITVEICGQEFPVYRGSSTADLGECDGLFTSGTGGANFAVRIARDFDYNGGIEPIFDRSGVMSYDGTYPDGSLVDRGDELFRGRGARVAVIDFAYWKGHEDLDQRNEDGTPRYQWKRFVEAPGIAGAANYAPRLPYVINEPGQTMIEFAEIGYPDHGTAVLGQLCALDEQRDWVDADGNPFARSYGVTGIVPEAQPYFFPLISVEEGPRELTAWSNAIAEFGPGDIICAPYEPAGVGTSLVGSPDVVLLTQVAFDKGIFVVVPAGNGKQNIDNIAEDAGVEDELGMCIVAASNFLEVGQGVPPAQAPIVQGDVPAGYRANGSNYGTLVDLHFWGEYNVSCGYGDLYSSITSRAPQDLQADRRRSYTGHFGGTSAAATNIAGAACALQGLAKQFYAVPATPGGLRDVAMKPYTVDQEYASNVTAGDDANPVGFQCNSIATNTLGQNRLANVLDNCSCENPECPEIISIGWRPRIWEFGRDDTAVVQLVSNITDANGDSAVFDNDAENLLGSFVIKGEGQGNFFSLKGDDGGRFRILSEFALGGSAGKGSSTDFSQGSFGTPALPSSFEKVVNEATRPVTGDVTDLLLLTRCPVDPGIVTSVTAEVQLLQPDSEFVLFGFQLWNTQTNRWALVDVATLPDEPGDPDLVIEFETAAGLGGASRYVDSENRAWARIWTWSLGSLFGSPEGSYGIDYDLTDVQFNFGPDPDGP